MRVRAMNDLHMEINGVTKAVEAVKALVPVDEDVWVLAGDITSMSSVIEAVDHYKAIDAVNPAVPKVVVLGNHEFWRLTPGKAEANFRIIQSLLPNFHFLDNSMVVVKGRRFIGGTMWYADEDGLNQLRERSFPDFHLIKGLVPWVYRKHDIFRKFLNQHLCGEDIVVTHHAPLYASVPEQYRGNDMNCFYVSDCSKLIEQRQPAAWFHGHTHEFRYYQAGKTWVVCNPRGYPSDGNTGFAPNLVVEIE